LSGICREIKETSQNLIKKAAGAAGIDVRINVPKTIDSIDDYQ
jgi:hypothetical protein